MSDKFADILLGTGQNGVNYIFTEWEERPRVRTRHVRGNKARHAGLRGRATILAAFEEVRRTLRMGARLA